MITLVVGLRGDEEDPCFAPSSPYPVTLLADLGMELLSETDNLWFVSFQEGNLVEAMASLARWLNQGSRRSPLSMEAPL